MSRKIPQPNTKPNSKITAPNAIKHSGVSFSFKHFHERDPFKTDLCGDGYFGVFLERLKALCGMTVTDLLVSRSGALRCHPIAWENTSQPNGFDHLNATWKEQIEAYQLSISSNEYGRVHGFFVDEVFYIVWLDPTHALYPRQN